MLEWCDEITLQVSNGKNLRDHVGIFLRKETGAKIRWDENGERDEAISESCITLLKKNFNKKQEGGWRLFFNVSLTNFRAHAMQLESLLEQEHYAMNVDAVSATCKCLLTLFLTFSIFLTLMWM